MKHIVKFDHGHDCIAFECINHSKSCVPGEGGSHGMQGLQIRFVSQGADGAVQFLLSTGWTPKFASPDAIGVRNFDTSCHKALPADLGYHAKKQQYDGQSAVSDACEFCDGEPCYYDGSGLAAYDAMYALVNGGDDALWKFLDAYYQHVFGSEPYPTPAEYCRPPRHKGEDR